MAARSSASSKVLEALRSHPEGLTFQQLRRVTGLSPQTLKKALQRMRGQGRKGWQQPVIELVSGRYRLREQQSGGHLKVKVSPGGHSDGKVSPRRRTTDEPPPPSVSSGTAAADYRREHLEVLHSYEKLAVQLDQRDAYESVKQMRRSLKRQGYISTGEQPDDTPASSVPLGGSFVSFGLHRVVLRFVPDVGLGGVRCLGGGWRVDGNGQRRRVWFLDSEFRRVTVQVNGDGSAQVYLEASGHPLAPLEFLGWVRFWLLPVFRELCGRHVRLDEFFVVSAPEFNLDIPGVQLEGAKCYSLEDYLDTVARVYEKQCLSMPEGGVRVEVQAREMQGQSLLRTVNGLQMLVNLPAEVMKLKEEFQQLHGFLTRRAMETENLLAYLLQRISRQLDILAAAGKRGWLPRGDAA